MRITALSGGVGGARMLRGFGALPHVRLTAIVNVGDDASIYGLHLAPDLDTVVYTLAHIESTERGWGRAGETWNTMAELEAFPIDTTFRLGDKDLALNLFRTARLLEGEPLSVVTAEIAAVLGVHDTILPVTDDRVRTKVRFEGVSDAKPAPGVIDAIEQADAIVIGPSNPFVSIWPILAVPGVAAAVGAKERIMGVSPLIGGAAVKGPLAEMLPSMGYEATTAGVVQAYDGLLTDFVVHRDDPLPPDTDDLRFHSAETLIADETAAKVLARAMVEWLS